MNNFYEYKTILGNVGIESENNKITNIYLNTDRTPTALKENELIYNTYIQINEYLSKKRTTFDIPINPNGTIFFCKVWKELTKIPYGRTRSYKDIAISIGHPKAYRAVGLANHRNPIPIIIPCHRVIGSTGKMIGFACGVDIKKFLLNIEK